MVRMASTDQLRRLHFVGLSERAAQRCLARLSRQRIAARISRRVGGIVPGSAPWTYSLGVTGQRLLGIAGPRGGRVRKPGAQSPLLLRHTLLVTEVYVRAVETTRASPLQLLGFATEPDCWRTLPDKTRLRPDAELTLGGEGYEDHFFIEADTGTEGQGVIKRKLAAYSKLFQSGVEQEATGVFPRVLFVTLTHERSRQLNGLIGRQRDPAKALFASVSLHDLTPHLAFGDDDISQ
ncbi:MAG: replication-relaxation family protein [Acidimicrobiales bacterium]